MHYLLYDNLIKAKIAQLIFSEYFSNIYVERVENSLFIYPENSNIDIYDHILKDTCNFKSCVSKNISVLHLDSIDHDEFSKIHSFESAVYFGTDTEGF